MLESLYSRYLEAGLWELSVFIINSRQLHSVQQRYELDKRVERIPIYQETNEEPTWSILNGDKDDIFVYDRCGRLVYHIPMPVSFLNKPYVGAAILNAYFNDPCGTCDNSTINRTEDRVNDSVIASEVLETNETILFNQDQAMPMNTNISRANTTQDLSDAHGHHGGHQHRHQHGFHGHRDSSKMHNRHQHHNKTEHHHEHHHHVQLNDTSQNSTMQEQNLNLTDTRHDHHHNLHHHHHQDRRKQTNANEHQVDNIADEQPQKDRESANETETTELPQAEITQFPIAMTEVTTSENVTSPSRRSSKRRNGRRNNNREQDQVGRRGRERNKTENMESRSRRHFFHDSCSSVKEDECKIGKRHFHIVRECCYLLPHNRISSRASLNCGAMNDIQCAKIYRLRECCLRLRQKEIKPLTNIFPMPVSCEGFNPVTCRLSRRLGFVHNECCPDYLYNELITELVIPVEPMCERIDKEQCQRFRKNGLTHLCCSSDHHMNSESTTN